MPKELLPTDQFVEIWTAGRSVHEVARKTGLTERQVVVKAAYLRRTGHPDLKYMGLGTAGARLIAHDKEVMMMERTLAAEPDISLAEYLRRRRPNG